MTDLNSTEKSKSPEGFEGTGDGAVVPPKGGHVPLPLKIAVYAMGIALVTMFALIGSRFMDRRAENRTAEAVEGTPWIIDVELQAPSGAIRSAVLDGRFLTVIIEGPSGKDQVVLIDTRKGQVVGKVRLAGD